MEEKLVKIKELLEEKDEFENLNANCNIICVYPELFTLGRKNYKLNDSLRKIIS